MNLKIVVSSVVLLAGGYLLYSPQKNGNDNGRDDDIPTSEPVPQPQTAISNLTPTSTTAQTQPTEPVANNADDPVDTITANNMDEPIPGNNNAQPPSGPGQSDELSITEQQERDINDRAYPLMAAKWEDTSIFVCWEETPDEFSVQRAQVQKAVEDSWEAASAIDFFGWGKCTSNASGIRIAVQDTGPHVKSLGSFVDGKRDGMVLNFTYENWGIGCQEKTEYCNRVIAIHEFGHAIGFAHEHNRPDTPGECDKSKQGTNGDTTELTPWDKESVMNYCNPIYGNDGKLSHFDKTAVQFIYGKA